MSLRIVFALGAAAACAALGGRAAGRLARRAQALSQWDKALRLIAGAVQYRRATALEAVRQGTGAEKTTLPALAERMRADPGKTPEALVQNLPWHAQADQETRQAVSAFLLALFLPTLPQQEQAMRLAKVPFDRLLKDARNAKEKYGRLAVSLGWLAGAAVFILLI